MGERRPAMDGIAWAFVALLAVLTALYAWAFKDAPTRDVDTAVMVERVTLGEGPCEVTVHTSSLGLLNEMGLQEWLAICRAQRWEMPSDGIEEPARGGLRHES